MTQNLRAAYAAPDLAVPSLWLRRRRAGRSQIVRLLYAVRVSLAVGLGAAALNLTLGVLLGLAAGFYRGPTRRRRAVADRARCARCRRCSYS